MKCDRPGECSPEKDLFVMTSTNVSTTWAEVIIKDSDYTSLTYDMTHGFNLFTVFPGSLF